MRHPILSIDISDSLSLTSFKSLGFFVVHVIEIRISGTSACTCGSVSVPHPPNNKSKMSRSAAPYQNPSFFNVVFPVHYNFPPLDLLPRLWFTLFLFWHVFRILFISAGDFRRHLLILHKKIPCAILKIIHQREGIWLCSPRVKNYPYPATFVFNAWHYSAASLPLYFS